MILPRVRLQKQQELGLERAEELYADGLISQQKQFKKPRKRAGSWWDRLNQVLLVLG
jgi:hypothetical protein